MLFLNRRIIALLAAIVYVSIGAMPHVTQSAHAQAWVQDMFEGKDHDFGIVPRGAKTEYVFEFENKYEQTLHVAEVRSSCGCTKGRVLNPDVKTYEKGKIICEFNTRSFVGPKAAVVTVVFDRPSYGEMQLTVKGNIRSDIVTEPGEVNFGDVAVGDEVIKQVKISYAGGGAWEIKDVRSENTNLGVSFPSPATRTRDGRVEYLMNVRLKDTAPVSELADQIVLVTSDTQYNLVTIPVRGVVLPPLRISQPSSIGTIKTGAEWTGRIVVRAKEPFSVKSIECDDSRITLTAPEGEKKLHVIPVTFVADGKIGAFRQEVKIVTSLTEDAVGSTYVSGNVVE